MTLPKSLEKKRDENAYEYPNAVNMPTFEKLRWIEGNQDGFNYASSIFLPLLREASIMIGASIHYHDVYGQTEGEERYRADLESVLEKLNNVLGE